MQCAPASRSHRALRLRPRAWIKPGQRRFTEADLPQGADKRALYELGRERLAAKVTGKSDWITLRSKAMGYGRLSPAATCIVISWDTPRRSPDPDRLGVSAIGDAGDAFAQNEKDLQRYQERVMQGQLPIQRGTAGCGGSCPAQPHSATHDASGDALDEPGNARVAGQRAGATGRARRRRLVQLDATGCRVTDRGRPSCATSAWPSMHAWRAACRTRRCSVVRSSAASEGLDDGQQDDWHDENQCSFVEQPQHAGPASRTTHDRLNRRRQAM